MYQINHTQRIIKMKTLFRIIVFCFCLFCFGFVSANQTTKGTLGYSLADSTVVYKQFQKEKQTKVFCQTEIETEYTKNNDKNDIKFNLESLNQTVYFIVIASSLAANTDYYNEKFCPIDIQQNRAKYLLFHSLKIPSNSTYLF